MPDPGECDLVRGLLVAHGITPLPEEFDRLVIAYGRARRNVKALDAMLCDEAEPVVTFNPQPCSRVTA